MANDKKTLTKPVATFRSHGISAEVFEKYAKDDVERERPFYNVQTVRTYKVDGKFKSAPVFGRDEVLIANDLNVMAWRQILQLEEEARKNRFAEAEGQ